MTHDFVQAVNRFLFVEDEPAPCDAIMIPGSSSPEHVLLAADLYHRGMAPVLIPSGRCPIGTERFTGDPAFDTEWAWMRSLLMAHGVPQEAILREDKATYTWENARLSRIAADSAGLTIRRGMLCCKGYHARRALLYYQAAFPETEWLVCPARIPGSSQEDWYLTREGQDRILGEVRRLGSQINDVFAEMLRQGGAE